MVVEVEDDGTGFDAGAPSTGFGLAGMRERVYLAGGRLELRSDQGGTVVRAELPVRDAGTAQSGAEQVAS